MEFPFKPYKDPFFEIRIVTLASYIVVLSISLSSLPKKIHLLEYYLFLYPKCAQRNDNKGINNEGKNKELRPLSLFL
jgi:hypothetical protein